MLSSKFFRWFRKSFNYKWVVLLFISLLISSAMLFLQPDSLVGHSSKTIFIVGLVNFNLILIVALVFVVGRNILRLIFDRRSKIHGSKLRQRLVTAFLGLTLIPTILMFILASGFINRATSGWFSSQVENLVDNALSVSQLYIEKEKSLLQADARQIVTLIKNKSYLSGLRKKYDLFSVTLYNQNLEEVFADRHVISKIDGLSEPKLQIPELGQEPVVTLHEKAGTQFLRLFQKVLTEEEENTLVITRRLEPEISAKLNALVDDYRQYGQLRYYRSPLTTSYLLTLALITGVILFAAIWFGFYLAREISEPLRKVSEATKRVATGDYDVHLDSYGDDELGDLVNSFNQMVVDLKQSEQDLIQAHKVSVWRDVARRLAHEIKNPLTPIKLTAQRLIKNYPNLNQQEFTQGAQTIVENVDNIKVLVDEFSRFARLPLAELVETDINNLLDDLITSYPATNLITFSPITELSSVQVDPAQFKRCIVNLLDNAVMAVAHNVEQGQISVSTAEDDEYIRIEVSDNGPGISPEVRPRIFDPYYTTKDSGTGLGLAIVASIVAEHKGRIRVLSNKPHGTRFVIELPK